MPRDRERISKARALIVVLFAVLASAAVFLLHGPLLVALSRLVLVEDPLENATAALVVAGDKTFEGWRVRAAARLYREGWVQKVVLSGARGSFGVYETQYSVPLAVSQGIRGADIIAVPNETRSIHDEASLLIALVEQQRFKSVYVVTASYKTRRTRRVFQRATHGGLRVLVYPAPDPSFIPDQWWKTTRGREMFLNGCFGLDPRD